MNRIALVPAYEPEKVLIQVVKSLYEHEFAVIVVNDGSGSEFDEVFNELDGYADVITYNENRGKGYALKTGLKYIADNYMEGTVVTVDADGQHLVEDTVKVCNEVEKIRGGSDEHGASCLVIGSRVLTKDSPTKSRLGNGITRFVFRTLTRVNVYDTQSGLRGFSVELIPFLLEIPGERYEYEMNVLLQMAKKKKKMKEVPITTVYFDKQNSVSHFNALHDSVKIYGEILKFGGSSFASFLVDYVMYALLIVLLGGMSSAVIIANYGARIVSSIFNFTVNKKFVFKTSGNAFKEAVKYFLLALFIISINSMILTAITALGCNAYIGKLFVELLMFCVSYSVQHVFIFNQYCEEK